MPPSRAFNACGSGSDRDRIRKLNAGDLRGACDELPRWRFAGGKGVRGLAIRRNKARQLCHEGLDGVPAGAPFRWSGA
ncbi:glycoside hydrolase family protein [Rhodovulum sp. MB263]|uniref:glycoside hydrolase family protein n=1 Tax=Rhodovulum sp. (strain MB263) TaxID=308754 RepID=UPI001E5905DC|nr:glycoside hydrolase family protein [Rhodovulum sp. MB263]